MHHYYYTVMDEVAEWLRRWTANPMGSARVGSNPILIGHFIFSFPSLLPPLCKLDATHGVQVASVAQLASAFGC